MIGQTIVHKKILEQLGEGGNPAISGQAHSRFHPEEDREP